MMGLYKHMRPARKEKGFTLIELSIVLIIIGLIVSGVLVGQDLISGAKLRSQITQIGEFNAAVNTFRLKYDATPGDIAGPATYSLTGLANATGAGNGILNDHSGATSIANATTEITGFWLHLSETGLIQGSYAECLAAATCTISTNIPPAKIGVGGVGVFGVSGVNYYQIGATTGAAVAVADYTNNLTPLEARTIDAKMDNGIPGTGIVLARTGTDAEPESAANRATGSCVTDVGADSLITTADVAYTLSTTTAACQVRIKMN